MGSSSMTLSMIDCPLPVEQRNPLAVRAPYCYADNCYRALFPCPSPWIVTQAVLYCATVSDDSATNYPTQAVAACGTGKERYISACSCPATNCPVKTTTQAAAVPSTVSSAVVLTTTAGNDTPENNAAPIPIPSPTTVMAAQGNVVPTQASENVGGEVDQDPDAGSGNEPTATEPATTVPPGTEEAPVDQVSITINIIPCITPTFNSIKAVVGAALIITGRFPARRNVAHWINDLVRNSSIPYNFLTGIQRSK
ncbi:hypothetical protein F5Y10DRAFT_252467 [Nemania abortiva]|nr:hypothetical protein F5Y10DRAFT_252467 [Nemania abortiva]